MRKESEFQLEWHLEWRASLMCLPYAQTLSFNCLAQFEFVTCTVGPERWPARRQAPKSRSLCLIQSNKLTSSASSLPAAQIAFSQWMGVFFDAIRDERRAGEMTSYANMRSLACLCMLPMPMCLSIGSSPSRHRGGKRGHIATSSSVFGPSLSLSRQLAALPAPATMLCFALADASSLPLGLARNLTTWRLHTSHPPSDTNTDLHTHTRAN